MNREERIDNLRFTIGYMSNIMDPTEQESVNSFNDLVSSYHNLIAPIRKDTKFEQEAVEMMKDFTKIKFKPVGRKNIEDFNG